MMKKNARLWTIAAMFVATVIVFSLIGEAASNTVRFETVFKVRTLDAIEINVRAFGDDEHPNNARAKVMFQHAMRDELSKMVYADIPRKMRVRFRKAIDEAAENGLKIDSLSQSIADAD